MRVLIRYQSRGGNVKEMAEIIASGFDNVDDIDVEPISIDDPRAPITEPVDVLFIGGALYKFKLDPAMEEYLENIPADLVRTAIVFGSSIFSHRPVLILKERLKMKGIDVNPSAVWMRGKPKPYLYEIMPPWALREVRKLMKPAEAEALDEEEQDTGSEKADD